MIERAIENRFSDYLSLFPVTGLIGPRQVGKTTLAKQLTKNLAFLYLDLERQVERDKLEEDPAFFLSQFSDRTVILDEIQFMPQLFSELRGLVDENRKPGRFIILGSASPDIIRGSSETLAGRIGYLQLTPFLLLEVSHDIEGLWVRGGFPESYLAKSERDSNLWRVNFIQTYIQRDLGLLGLQTNVQLMERFWRMLAGSQGAFLNSQRLGRSLGVSNATIMRYTDFLEGAFMLRILRPWFKNQSKRLVKSPKIYIRDSGLLHSLLGLTNLDDLLNNVHVGASWEGFVIEQIINHSSDDLRFYFYRTHQGAECDLLIEKNGRVKAICEIKLGTSPKVNRGFRISMGDTNALQGYIIGNNEETYKVDENITITNLEYFLEKIIAQL